jgi:hypothetical protein
VSARASAWILAGALLVSALVRWPLLTRQGLWVDEVFSLAIATGHSLEHPAAEADPALGDFVEGEAPRPAREWRTYLRHDDPPAGPARVVRAVLLSDTSPPLYYLLLWGWTRVLGTSDGALRAFSLVCALACLPLLVRLAAWAGGRKAGLPACVLYAFLPLAIYYGTEGRMYALLWLCVLAYAWSTAVLQRRGASALRALAWVAAGACGFLTHYFFVFVWSALTLLFFLRPGRCTRVRVLGGVALTFAVILPWYARLAESLGRWRVTQDWLTWKPDGFARGAAARELFLGYFTGSEENQWGEHALARGASLALFALLGGCFLWRLRARAFAPRRLALWSWLAAAWAGPLVFDAVRGTYTVAVSRYALAGMPAALLLAAVALGTLGPWLRFGVLGALCVAWAPHLELMARMTSRSWCPLREVAHTAGGVAGEIVLVHSIPSGLLGVARYYGGEAELAPWVEQLGRRTLPGSVQFLARGKRKIHLVRVHEVSAACPVEDWLRENAALGQQWKRDSARVLHFRPRVGEEF